MLSVPESVLWALVVGVSDLIEAYLMVIVRSSLLPNQTLTIMLVAQMDSKNPSLTGYRQGESLVLVLSVMPRMP